MTEKAAISVDNQDAALSLDRGMRKTTRPTRAGVVLLAAASLILTACSSGGDGDG